MCVDCGKFRKFGKAQEENDPHYFTIQREPHAIFYCKSIHYRHRIGN